MNSDLKKLLVNLHKEYLFTKSEKQEIETIFNDVQSTYEELFRRTYILNCQQYINMDRNVDDNFRLEHIKRFFLLESKARFTKFRDMYCQYEYVICDLFKYLASNVEILAEFLIFCDINSVNLIRTSKIVYSSIIGCGFINETQNIMKILLLLLEKQFCDCSDPQKMIITGKSAFLRLFKFFIDNSSGAKTFLIATLQEPILYVLMNDEMYLDVNLKLSLERLRLVEKQKLFGDPKLSEKYRENIKKYHNNIIDRIAEIVHMFLNKLMDSFSLLPQNYVTIVNCMFRVLSKNSCISKIDVLKTCIDFIFDCFIYPAMLNPESYGIIGDLPLSIVSKYNLMEIGKVIKSLIYLEINKNHEASPSMYKSSIPDDLIEKFNDYPLDELFKALSIWSEMSMYNIEADMENCVSSESSHISQNDGKLSLRKASVLIADSDLQFLLRALQFFSSYNESNVAVLANYLDKILNVDVENTLSLCVRQHHIDEFQKILKDKDSVSITNGEVILVLIIDPFVECPGMFSEEKVLLEYNTRRKKRSKLKKGVAAASSQSDGRASKSEIHSSKVIADGSNSLSSLGRQSSRPGSTRSSADNSDSESNESNNQNNSNSNSCNNSNSSSSSTTGSRSSNHSCVSSSIETGAGRARECNRDTSAVTVTDYGTTRGAAAVTHSRAFTTNNNQQTDKSSNVNCKEKNQCFYSMELSADGTIPSDIVEGSSEIASMHSMHSEDVYDSFRTDVCENNQNNNLQYQQHQQHQQLQQQQQHHHDHHHHIQQNTRHRRHRSSSNYNNPGTSLDTLGLPAVPPTSTSQISVSLLSHQTGLNHTVTTSALLTSAAIVTATATMATNATVPVSSSGNNNSNTLRNNSSITNMTTISTTSRQNTSSNTGIVNDDATSSSADLLFWHSTLSGRDTPSISGGRESPTSSVGGASTDLPVSSNKPDVTEKFNKFDIPKPVEARSTVSDTWSTDVLASDSETTEQMDQNNRRLMEIQEENPLLAGTAAIASGRNETEELEQPQHQQQQQQQLFRVSGTSPSIVAAGNTAVQSTNPTNIPIVNSEFENVTNSGSEMGSETQLSKMLSNANNYIAVTTPAMDNSVYRNCQTKSDLTGGRCQNSDEYSTSKESTGSGAFLDSTLIPNIQLENALPNSLITNTDSNAKLKSNTRSNTGGTTYGRSKQPQQLQSIVQSTRQHSSMSASLTNASPRNPVGVEIDKTNKTTAFADENGLFPSSKRGFVFKIKERLSKDKAKRSQMPTRNDSTEPNSRKHSAEELMKMDKQSADPNYGESVAQMLQRYGGEIAQATNSSQLLTNLQSAVHHENTSSNNVNNNFNSAQQQMFLPILPEPPLFIDPNLEPEQWPAWDVAKRNLRSILERHYMKHSHDRLLELQSSSFGMEYNSYENDVTLIGIQQPLMRLLQVFLADATHSQINPMIAQLEETLRVLRLFDQQSLSRLVMSMLKDWKLRRVYITYLVNTRTELQMVQQRAQDMLNSCKRSCQLSARSMISFCVHEILRKQGTRFDDFFKRFHSINSNMAGGSVGGSNTVGTISNTDIYMCTNSPDNDVSISASSLPNSSSRPQLVTDMLDWASRVLNNQNYLVSMTKERQQETRQYLERVVMSQLHRSSITLNDGIAEVERDNVFHREVERLQRFITPYQLSVNKKFSNLIPFETAQKELKKINCYKTPLDKVHCILQTTERIAVLLKMTSPEYIPGADDIFPVLIYVIIMANPSRLLSNMSYIEALCATQLEGQNQYMWCQFTAAVDEVRTLLTSTLVSPSPCETGKCGVVNSTGSVGLKNSNKNTN